MRVLCKELGRNDLDEELQEYLDDICFDRRWMRNSWSGPYFDGDCSEEFLGKELFDKYKDVLTYGTDEE